MFFGFSSIMFVLLCIEACSPLDFVNETPDCYSEELATATKGSNASDIFYYYFVEKIFLQEREDMLFLKFVDNESRELFLKEILNGISLLKVYNPSGELQFESPDSSDILILESGAGAITDISVELYARTIDCPGNVRLGVEIDNLIPTYYSTFAFGWGNTYYTTLANTTVPGGSRRRLYINILDPM